MNNWNNLKPEAQLWFYLAEKPYPKDVWNAINQKLETFCGQWMAHGEQVHAGYEAISQQIIILGADNSWEPVSGCSIDSSVKLVRSIETSYGGDLFNRMRAAVDIDNEWQVYSTLQISELIDSGRINEQSQVLNTFVQTKGQLDSQKTLDINQTWLKRFLKAKA